MTRLRAGRSGIRVLVGPTVQTSTGVHRICYLVGAGVLSHVYRGRCRHLTTHLHPGPSSRKSGTARLLSYVPSWHGEESVDFDLYGASSWWLWKGSVRTSHYHHLWARSHKCEKQILDASCLSAWNNTAPTGRICKKFDIRVFFENLRETQALLKSDKIKGCFTWRPIHIVDHISLSSPENEKCFRHIL